MPATSSRPGVASSRAAPFSRTWRAAAPPTARSSTTSTSRASSRAQARPPSAAGGIAVRNTPKATAEATAQTTLARGFEVAGLLIGIFGAPGDQRRAGDRQDEADRLERRQAVAGGDAPDGRDDGAERADRRRDRERAELGRLVEPDQPTRVTDARERGVRDLRAGQRRALRPQAGTTMQTTSAASCEIEQDGDQRVAACQLRSDEVRHAVTRRRAEGEDDR